MWRKEQATRVSKFLKLAQTPAHSSTKQVKLVPLAGFEWEARTLNYYLVDSAVGMAKQRSKPWMK